MTRSRGCLLARADFSGQTRVPNRTLIKTLQVIAAGVALLGAAILADDYAATGWWFWVGVASATTLVFLEPRYTTRESALVLGLASVGVYFGADTSGVETAWQSFLALAIVVIVSALIALGAPDGRARGFSKYLATRLGRPQVLAITALSIEAIRVSASVSVASASLLAIGIALAFLVASLDWIKIAGYLPKTRVNVARVEFALEPNVLVVSSKDRLGLGRRVKVSSDGVSDATVASWLAHRDGPRMMLVLDKPWTAVTDASGSDCVLSSLPDPDEDVVAFASAGSTERTVTLHPLKEVPYGATVYWSRNEASYLYQVSALRLERDNWDSALTIEPRGTAIQLGAVHDDGGFDFSPTLPHPYEPLRSAASFTADLPGGFHEIGVVTGTRIPFGVSADALQSHHLAILGMSGMGKTTFSRRLIELMSGVSAVVALDSTGEYRSKFGFPEHDPASRLEAPGSWIHEPTGVQSKAASEFIKELMQIASDEYSDGEPRMRTLLLEEAHTFLPEWNFNAAKSDSEWVSKSCRYILQARKFGINFILVSQRTAVISKSALSQCESYVIFRTLDGTSLDYVESVVGPDLRQAVPSLARYQAVCVGPAFSAPSGMIVDLHGPP